jgi:hypothetical protein
VPDAQLALDGSGAIDEYHPPAATLPRLDRAMPRPGALPAPEVPLDGGEGLARIHGAGDHDVGHVGGVVRGVECTGVLDAERLERLRRARRQPPVRDVAGEHLAKEALVGQPAGIGTSLEDVVQPLGPQPIELLGIEARGEDHLGKQPEAVVELAAEGGEAGPRAVP